MLTIKATAMGGDDVSETIEQMCVLASRLGCIVELKFNDVTMMAKPGCDPRDLHAKWEVESGAKSQYKIVCAQPVTLPRAWDRPAVGKGESQK